jgi:O-antigen/teichoic acid export membrane protein
METKPGGTGATVLWTTISNAAVPLAALLTGPLLARVLAPDGRGQLAAVLTPLLLGPLVLTFGLPEAVVYHVAGRRASLRAAVRASLLLGAGSGLIAGGLLAALAPLLLRNFDGQVGLLIALSATLPFYMSVAMLRSVAQGRQDFTITNRERWLSVLSRTALIVALAAAGSLTVTAAAWATHGTSLLATVLLVPVLLWARRTPEDERPWAETRLLMRRLLRYGLPAWAGTMSGILILRLDQVLLTPLSSARQLGLYAVAVSVAELPAIALLAVRDVGFASAVGRGDQAFVARIARAVVLLCVPSLVIGVALAPLAIPLVFGQPFEDSARMTQVLLLGLLPSGVGGVVLQAGLLGSGRPGLASVAQVSAALLTVVGLVALVPHFGALGAAWTTVASYLLAMTIGLVALTRISGLPLRDYLVPRRADLRDLGAMLRGIARRARAR